jgi:ABC-type branched-subunit amino acid transport system ATPase component/sugar phosphate permease
LQAPSVLDADPDVKAARRTAARATLGVTGQQESAPLRPILREHSLTLYPLAAIGLLGVVDVFQAQAFTVLTPEISRSLGLGLGAIGAARTLAFLATILAPLPMAALSQHRGRRALLCIVTGLVWSVITLFTGMVTSLLALIAVLVLDGASTGSVAALHSPLLVDSYPPKARVRVLSGYSALTQLGQIASLLIVGSLAGPLGFTWRGVFIGLGLISTTSTLFALGLRDPGPGRFDTDLLRAEEHEKVTGDHVSLAEVEDTLASEDTQLGFFEILRRVLLIPTVKRLAIGFQCLGILVVPLGTYLSTYLDERWGLGPGGRGLFFAGVAAFSVVALLLFGSQAEKVFRRDPAQVLSLSGLALGLAVSFIAVGSLMPVFWLVCVFFGIGQSLVAVLTPGLTASLLSILDARYRPHAAAVVGMFTAGGSILGVVFLTGIDKRFGISGAIFSLIFPGVLAGVVVRSAGKLINKDLDRMIDEVLESEDIRVIKERGGHLPMLACRQVDFSYGQLQVLFDVNFAVDEGEMVALLGTNGAGKSTLLKVVSGIGLPSMGTVRFRGEDITYLDAERRVPLGITQVPGGRAVFGTMDVVENLRTFGYSLRRDRKRVEESIEMCLEAFPRLRERRTSLASTLSGGEQQMLGLSKALILQPKLLLIDELSLGLAPVIVGQLLEMVRRINHGGTAVVLVEQSVNIALSLVDHAYFMEKGEMRFDGPAQQLLVRDDLLRAVFLEGAAKADMADSK